MARGRRTVGEGHVDKLDGSEEARKRLRVILEALSGKRTMKDACRELGLSEARLHRLRDVALQGALEAIEPQTAGRPPAAGAEEKDEHLTTLEAEVRELRIDLRAAQVREEIAAVMPHLLKPRAGDVKKTDKSSSQEIFGRPRSGGRRQST